MSKLQEFSRDKEMVQEVKAFLIDNLEKTVLAAAFADSSTAGASFAKEAIDDAMEACEEYGRPAPKKAAINRAK